MPNWCVNTLKINGRETQIQRLPWRESGCLLFQPLIPCPHLTPKKQYQWKIDNWSVKWDAEVTVVDRYESYLELQFDTPWTSPFKGINKIASMFSLLSLEMKSSEPGCDWQELCCWQDGNLIQKLTGHFYQQSSLQCPKCRADYHPEIDLDGAIICSECDKCGWCS